MILEEAKRPTWAEISLSKLENNCRHLISRSGDAKVLGMVKANAYGHGAVEISKNLVKFGVRALGVATVEEGAELRESGLKVPIIVFGGLMGQGTKAANVMVDLNLTPVVHSAAVLECLSEAAKGKVIDIHVKIDTGMGRLGMMPKALASFVSKLKLYKNLNVAGVLTHLSSASDEVWSAHQISELSNAVALIEKEIGCVPAVHFSNSKWLMEHPDKVCVGGDKCLVRPGIALYGIGEKPLEPILSLKSSLALIKRIGEGASVSYDRTWKAKRPSRIAVVPIGYADGYPWAAGNKAKAIVNGKKVPLVGRVTMDMIILDVTDVTDAQVGDTVTLIGKDRDEEITAIDLALWSDTISYEILSRISPRVHRRYV